MSIRIVLFGSCNEELKPELIKNTIFRDWNQTIPGNFSGQSKTVFDSTEINLFINNYPLFKAYAGDVWSFYRKRNYTYAWFEQGSLIEQAGNLANRVLNLQEEGIYSHGIYKNELDSLIYEVSLNKKKPNIELELMLTAQYFVFSKLAWQGMNSEMSRSTKWYLPRKKVDYDKYLDSLLKMPAKSPGLNEPVYRQYELLRNYLRKYQALDSIQNWDRISNSKKKLKLGDTSAVIEVIKKRLFLLGDYHGDTLDLTFTDELLMAIKQFQERHGLNMDGLLNKETIDELNVPLKNRIKQIIVNMERCRWLPINLTSDFLVVNIPEFKLHVYHADSLLWSCKVVVGKTMHQTTVFYGEIKYIVFSPYWNVPNGILVKEVIPAMRKNTNYLSSHHMEVTGYRDGLPVIRQKPGPENSLGLVKFIFPNSYNIYLHDTPSKSLFGESSRAFSHGCIRLGEPVKLANFLLKEQKEWNAEKIDSAMNAGRERYVTLNHKVPVFITYLTTFIDSNNKINFRKDIYKLDERLSSMIISGKGEY